MPEPWNSGQTPESKDIRFLAGLRGKRSKLCMLVPAPSGAWGACHPAPSACPSRAPVPTQHPRLAPPNVPDRSHGERATGPGGARAEGAWAVDCGAAVRVWREVRSHHQHPTEGQQGGRLVHARSMGMDAHQK